jgi:hypothetical protein
MRLVLTLKELKDMIAWLEKWDVMITEVENNGEDGTVISIYRDKDGILVCKVIH